MVIWNKWNTGVSHANAKWLFLSTYQIEFIILEMKLYIYYIFIYKWIKLRGDNVPPVLYYLSGLTCTDENARTKAGFVEFASNYKVAVVFPGYFYLFIYFFKILYLYFINFFKDTSPRNLNI